MRRIKGNTACQHNWIYADISGTTRLLRSCTLCDKCEGVLDPSTAGYGYEPVRATLVEPMLPLPVWRTSSPRKGHGYVTDPKPVKASNIFSERLFGMAVGILVTMLLCWALRVL